MEVLKSIVQGGCMIRIVQDEDPPSPREWDNIGTILYASRQYVLGDKRVSEDEIKEITERDDVIWLPVYAYIHSGITMNTSGFSCPWDSGMSGIIYVETEKARQEWGDKYTYEKVKTVLKAEIETYDQYLTGDIYGFIVEKDDEQVDSCWGFYGKEGVKDAVEQAKAAVEMEVAEAERVACQT